MGMGVSNLKVTFAKEGMVNGARNQDGAVLFPPWNASDAVDPLTYRSDDTDLSPVSQTAKPASRLSTKEIVARTAQRSMEIEGLLRLGCEVVRDPAGNDMPDLDSPAPSETSKWENLHDEAKLCLEGIQSRLFGMAVVRTRSDETALDSDGVPTENNNLAAEAQHLRQEVAMLQAELLGIKQVHQTELREATQALTKELNEVKEANAELKEEVGMLNEQLYQQAAAAGRQRVHEWYEARKTHAPSTQVPSTDTSAHHKIPQRDLSSQMSGSNAHIQHQQAFDPAKETENVDHGVQAYAYTRIYPRQTQLHRHDKRRA